MREPDAAVAHRADSAPLSELSPTRIWGMLESAPDGMLMTDELGVILAVNQQIERLFGYDRADLLGRKVEILLPERTRDAHQLHRAHYRDEPRLRAMGQGLQLSARRRDGSEFPVEVSLSPLLDTEGLAVVASVRDVTEHVAAARRLSLSEETFRTSFENAPVGMTMSRVVDGQSVLERVNAAFAEMLGRSTESLIGVDLLDISHPGDQQMGKDAAAEMTSGNRDALVTEMRFRHADGRYLWALVHSSVIDRSDGVRTLTHVADITDRRERQSERERMSTIEDRERIARDLHDLVIQRLFGAGMKLQAVIPEMGSATAVDRTHETIEELDVTIREIRSAIFSLQRRGETRSVTDELTRAIDQYDDRLGFRPRFVIDGPLDDVTAEHAAELTATVREALSNVARHAAATSTDVRVSVTASSLSLTVTDDGCGVAPNRPRGNGLENMATRASKLGGRSTLTSLEPTGSELAWTIPRTPSRDLRP